MRLVQQLRYGLWRPVVLYLLLGLVWLVAGTWLLGQLVSDPAQLRVWTAANAGLFLVVACGSAASLIRARLDQVLQAQRQLAESGCRDPDLLPSAPWPQHDAQDFAVQRFEHFQALSGIGYWELDLATGLGSCSRQIYRMLGCPLPSGDQLHEGLPALMAVAGAEGLERMQCQLQALANRSLTQLDLFLSGMTGHGQRRTWRLRAALMQASGANHIQGTLQDVSQDASSPDLPGEREDQFRQVVGVLPDGVVVFHQEQVLYANTACAELLGHAQARLTGEQLCNLVEGDDLAWVRKQMASANGPADAGFTGHMRRADGAIFRAGLSLGDVRYAGMDCKLMFIRDLSQAERMRDALASTNGELQAMARRLFSLQEDERRSISRDLHDDIGQSITAMKLSAHAALGEAEPVRRGEDLQEIMRLADTTLVRLRNLSMLLRPPQLDALGLEAALRWQASMLFRASAVRLQMEIQPLSARPGVEVEQACFRIAQEGLTNALRHACAGEVRLELHEDVHGRQLCLQVVDDGDGFDPAGPRGLGLIVMRERAQSSGGHLQIDSAPGAGTRITLRLPYSGSAPTTMPGP